MKRICISLLVLALALPVFAAEGDGRNDSLTLGNAMLEVWDRCFGNQTTQNRLSAADSNRVKRALWYANDYICETNEQASVGVDTITTTALTNEYDLPQDYCGNFLPRVFYYDSTTYQLISLLPEPSSQVGKNSMQDAGGGGSPPQYFAIEGRSIIIDPCNSAQILVIKYSRSANHPSASDSVFNISNDYKSQLIYEACSIILNSTYSRALQQFMVEQAKLNEAKKAATMQIIEAKKEKDKLLEMK